MEKPSRPKSTKTAAKSSKAPAKTAKSATSKTAKSATSKTAKSATSKTKVAPKAGAETPDVTAAVAPAIASSERGDLPSEDTTGSAQATGGATTSGSKVRARKVSPIDIAMEKYISNDWNIIKPPRGAVNDFMASRGNRFHFVQVVTKATIDDAKFHGEAKNNFVQNAFSNGALPIFAHVVEGPKPKVTFEDVNTGNRALISARTKKADDEK